MWETAKLGDVVKCKRLNLSEREVVEVNKSIRSKWNYGRYIRDRTMLEPRLVVIAAAQPLGKVP